MKRVFAALSLALNLALVCAAQAPPEWVKYTSAEGRYSVRLPAEPKLSTQESNASTGESMKQYMAQATDSNALYGLAYFDYTPTMTFSLDRARDSAVGNVKGTLLSESSISLGGYPGRELKISAKTSDDGEFLIRARMYDVGRRVYILQFLVLKPADKPEVAEKGDRFFDSFKVETGR